MLGALQNIKHKKIKISIQYIFEVHYPDYAKPVKESTILKVRNETFIEHA